MRAFFQRVLPDPPGNQPALMGRIEHDLRTNAIGDLAHLAHRMFKQVQAAAHGDQFRAFPLCQFRQRRHIDGIARGIHRRADGAQPEQTGAARHMMGNMPADGGRRRDDRIPGLTGRHEAIQVGNRARRHPDFCIVCIKHFGAQFGGDHFDLLNRFQPHLIFIAGIAQRGARPDARGQHRLRLWIHHIGGRVQIEAIALMDLAVLLCQGHNRGLDLCGGLRGHPLGNPLHIGFTLCWNPLAMRQGHDDLSYQSIMRSHALAQDTLAIWCSANASSQTSPFARDLPKAQLKLCRTDCPRKSDLLNFALEKLRVDYQSSRIRDIDHARLPAAPEGPAFECPASL